MTVPFALTNANWSLLTVAIFYGFFTGILRVFFWEVIEAVRPAGTALTAVGMLWTVEGLCMAIGAAAGGWSADHLSPRATLLMITISLGVSFLTIIVNSAKLKTLYKNHLEKANERAKHL
jgi:MFS family permease